MNEQRSRLKAVRSQNDYDYLTTKVVGDRRHQPSGLLQLQDNPLVMLSGMREPFVSRSPGQMEQRDRDALESMAWQLVDEISDIKNSVAQIRGAN